MAGSPIFHGKTCGIFFMAGVIMMGISSVKWVGLEWVGYMLSSSMVGVGDACLVSYGACFQVVGRIAVLRSV